MAVVQPEGVTVYLTGQVTWSPDERIIGKGDVETQTRQCFANIQWLLKATGGTLSDIVSVTTYFTCRSQLPLIQKIRAQIFAAGAEPASTPVVVAGHGP